MMLGRRADCAHLHYEPKCGHPFTIYSYPLQLEFQFQLKMNQTHYINLKQARSLPISATSPFSTQSATRRSLTHQSRGETFSAYFYYLLLPVYCALSLVWLYLLLTACPYKRTCGQCSNLFDTRWKEVLLLREEQYITLAMNSSMVHLSTSHESFCWCITQALKFVVTAYRRNNSLRPL